MNRKSFLKTSGLLLAGAMTGNLQAKDAASPRTTAHAVVLLFEINPIPII